MDRPARVNEARRRGQMKAVVSVHAGGPFLGGDKDYKREEAKRIKGEIAALEKQLAEFDEKKAAGQVRSALDLELRRKKLRLEENGLEK